MHHHLSPPPSFTSRVGSTLLPLALVALLTLSFIIVPMRETFPGGGREHYQPPPPLVNDEELLHHDDKPLPSSQPPTTAAHSLAESLITRLQSDPDYGLGPLVVGGIGDSGTRAVREVLRFFGVQMLAHARVNIPGDSEIFQSAFRLVDSFGNGHEMLAVDLYTPAIKHGHKIDYEPRHATTSDQWEMGRQWVALQTQTSMNYSRWQRTNGKNLGLWGFKHPRTSLMLPYLLSALGAQKFRFLHVLRDPKEVVFGNNQQIFDSLCDIYYGHVCDKGPGKKLEFWVHLNRDISRFAKTFLGPAHYLPIRIEDLVLKREACYVRLAEFAGLTLQRATAMFRDAVNVTKGHEASYFGHTVNADARKLVYDAIAASTNEVRRGIEMWGFSTSTFQLTLKCEELPGW